MKLENQEKALEYLNTEVKKEAQGPGEIGKATISEEIDVVGHKAWAYHIEGIWMHGNTTGRQLLDTGEILDTEAFGNDTIEKAYKVRYGKELTQAQSKVLASCSMLYLA